MTLPAFLSGLCGLVIVSVIIGLWAGFSAGHLILFVVTVLVMVQIAYLAVIVGLSVMHSRERALGTRSRIIRGLSRLMRENEQ